MESVDSSAVRKAEWGLCFITVLWGLTFPMIRMGVEDLDSLYFVFARFTVAAIAFIPILLWQRVRWTHFHFAIVPGAYTGFLMALVFIFQTIGLETVGAGRAAFITSSSVIFVPFFSPLFGRGRPRGVELIASLVALVGLFLIMDPSFKELNSGDLWILACALVSAVGIHALGIAMTRPVQIYALVFVQIVTVALTALAGIWLSSRTIPESLSGQSMVSILVCALLVTVIAFVIQAKSQRIVSPERTALIYSLEPLFAVIFGFLLLNELLSLTTFVGGALVLLAVSHNVVRKLCVNFFNFFTK